MNSHIWREAFEERLVTYTQEIEGRLLVIEHVPARICVETGEQLFSPETVSRIQAIIRGQSPPVRVLETPVYEFCPPSAEPWPAASPSRG